MVPSISSQRLVRYTKNPKDAYRSKTKLMDKTICPKCASIYMNGRWTQDKIEDIETKIFTLCPACIRDEEHMPAGHVQLKGEFLKNHIKEIEGRIRNIEKIERKYHPLERIITYEKSDSHIYIATTGIHLARRIGEGLHKSFKGNLSLSYGPNEHKISLSWER